MGIRVCVLGSGSSGNCTYVGGDGAALLIDAGLSGRETTRRLAEIGVDVGDILGICISHEHSDHTAGLRVLHGRHGIPVYANAGTVEGVQRDSKFAGISWRVFTTGAPFQIGSMLIEPFAVPHDAYDPVGFVVTHGAARVGIVTDMGVATTLVRQRLKQCQAVVVEANHDEKMLQEAPRPWHLKQRIMGRQGHLSNEGAAAVLADIAGPDLRQVFLAHISDECNCEDLALRTTKNRLAEAGHIHVHVSATFSNRISEICAL